MNYCISKLENLNAGILASLLCECVRLRSLKVYTIDGDGTQNKAVAPCRRTNKTNSQNLACDYHFFAEQ